MQKRTHDEFVKALKIINPSIEVLEEYINVDTPIKVKCTNCGKIWNTTPNNLLVGHGCGRCSNRKTHKQFVEDLASKNPNIEVLGQYIDAKTPITVRCKVCGLEWNSKPRQLIGGHGCRQCAIKKQASARRKTQEQFESDLSIINSSVEIIGAYKGNMAPIECKCKKCNFTWNAFPGNLLKGQGCPRCASYRHTSFPEQAIFFYIHKYLPDAVNSYKAFFEKNMEIDIFIPTKSIGIEYDGKAWHNDKKAYEREIKKYSICQERNIMLIRVKELKQENDYLTADHIIYTGETLEETLFKVASILGTVFDVNLERDSTQIFEQYMSDDINADFMQKLSAINPGVIPLSSYTLSSDKIKCKCVHCGFEWMATPNKLLSGRSCPKCSGRMKKNTKQFVEDLQTVNPDIEVIGEYYNASTPILVRCKKCNYEWSPTASSILHGNGCPRCSHRLKISHEQFINEMKKVNADIEIIGEYKTKRTPVWVRCSKCGREWQTTPDNLLRNHGCAECAGKLKKTTEEFAEKIFAINSNFRVEGEYINARTKIKVVCNKCGYERTAVPYSLLKRLHCPHCDNLK